MNVEGQWNANLFQVLLWTISSIPVHQSLRIYGTYFTCAFNSYCLKFFIGMCGGVRGGLLMPVWVHLETRVRCHMSYPAPLHLVPLRYSISLTLKLGWWTVNPTGLPVNCYIWFFPLFRFYCTCVCVCLYIHVSACSCRGQKKTLDSLQLEL